VIALALNFLSLCGIDSGTQHLENKKLGLNIEAHPTPHLETKNTPELTSYPVLNNLSEIPTKGIYGIGTSNQKWPQMYESQ
jgi:hypothetical protein